MKINKTVFIVSFGTFVFALVGCATPSKLVILPKPNGVSKSSVFFYREKTWVEGNVGTELGIDGIKIAILTPKTYLDVDVPSGNHIFYVRGGSSIGLSRTEVDLKNGEHVCFLLKPRSSNLVKSLIPILYFTGTTFDVVKNECPDSVTLTDFQKIDVQYN